MADFSIFPVTGPCLISSDKLSAEDNLRVPIQQKPTLAVEFQDTNFAEPEVWQNGCKFQGSVGEVVLASVVYVNSLTCENPKVVRKLKREIQVELNEKDAKSLAFLNAYDAGDSVYFIFPNPSQEVDIILKKLNLTEKADCSLQFFVSEENALTFTHFPNPCSCRYLLTYCLDIRRSPGRPVLRALASFCSDKKEERRLLELCSVQGTQEFTAFVRQTGISIVDLLLAFPSCQPSIACLMELLPRLLPRAYSISNYKFGKNKKKLRFVYSLLETLPASNGIQFARFGVCTSWLKSLQVGDSVKLLLKEPSKFRLPPFLKPNLNFVCCPLILVGPGTGVAPFMSFLQKIRAQIGEKKGAVQSTRRYLFYASSDLSEEFLFENELKLMQSDGILTDLILCESRKPLTSVDGIVHPKYVYDGLRAKAAEVLELLLDTNAKYPALFYSCGDVKSMSKKLWSCLSDLCAERLGYSKIEAIEFLQRLRKEECLIEDVWS